MRRCTGRASGRCRSSGRRSSPASPTSTRATSRRTSPAASKFGYLLVWVIVASNLMAMLIQTLSAKLGIVTRRNLPEVCRDQFSRRTSFLLWVQAEVIAMATDLAEFLGAAIGFQLLSGRACCSRPCITGDRRVRDPRPAAVRLPPVRGGDRVDRRRDRRLLPVELCLRAARLRRGRQAAFVPQFDGSESVLLAVGILGATVMPHVIYLHSALTQDRIVAEDDADARRLLRYTRIDVIVAMAIAGLINLSMLVMAAATFSARAACPTSTRSRARTRRWSRSSAGARRRSSRSRCSARASRPRRSGRSSGQVVMQGFIRRRIPVWVRRLVTMVPAFVVVAIGVDPTRTLVLSQVVLSFGIPFALVPLIMFTSRRDLMGQLVNRRITTSRASCVAARRSSR